MIDQITNPWDIVPLDRKQIRRHYWGLRENGWLSNNAWKAAKIITLWDKLEREGLVYRKLEYESESYFDVYGEPDPYTDRYGRRYSTEEARKQIIAEIDLHGLYQAVAGIVINHWSKARGTYPVREPISILGMILGYKYPDSHHASEFWVEMYRETLIEFYKMEGVSLDHY